MSDGGVGDGLAVHGFEPEPCERCAELEDALSTYLIAAAAVSIPHRWTWKEGDHLAWAIRCEAQDIGKTARLEAACDRLLEAISDERRAAIKATLAAMMKGARR
jgi:hypothetical protein